MVVDTSVLLGVLFAEQHAEWAAEQLTRARGTLKMSTVNLAEALIRVRDRQPTLADDLERRILESGIEFVAPDAAQARAAAEARLRYPLDLGDCFAYALARAVDEPIVTLDEDFRALDWTVVLP